MRGESGVVFSRDDEARRVLPGRSGACSHQALARIWLRLARDFSFGRQNPIPATIYASSCIFSNPNPPLGSPKMSMAERKAAALARQKKSGHGTVAATTTSTCFRTATATSSRGGFGAAAAASSRAGFGAATACSQAEFGAATASSQAGFGAAAAASTMAGLDTAGADLSTINGRCFTSDSSHARGGSTGASVWWDVADGGSPSSPAFRRPASWDRENNSHPPGGFMGILNSQANLHFVGAPSRENKFSYYRQYSDLVRLAGSPASQQPTVFFFHIQPASQPASQQYFSLTVSQPAQAQPASRTG